MWELNYTTKFKKDLKRYQRSVSKLAALKTVLGQLQQTGTVQASYKPHHLAGEYIGCMECHIEENHFPRSPWFPFGVVQIRVGVASLNGKG